MITRAMQRSNNSFQTYDIEQPVLFNKQIISWTSSSPSVPAITYNAGVFYIPNASLSDYMMTWSISVKTSTRLDTLGCCFLFDMDYGDGEVIEGNFSHMSTTSGMIKGFKLFHVVRTSEYDILSFSIKNNSFINMVTLPTPSQPLPTDITADIVYNANLCIMSI